MYLSRLLSCNTCALPCYHVYKLQLIFPPLARTLMRAAAEIAPKLRDTQQGDERL